MMDWLKRPKPEPEQRFATPDGVRIYAIGDIHGRLDLLTETHARIAADIAAADSSAERNVVIHLGDYVDRGPQSREVIETFLDVPIPGADSVHLMGNHERFMLDFLEDSAVGPNWILNGGDITMFSYGVGYPPSDSPGERLERMRAAFAEAMPQRHLAFLSGLKLQHREGDYVFVHAGIRPGRPLEAQVEDDLLWIRREFLESREDFGVCVVHGHTIVPEPDFRCNRIAIDTGAVRTGRLTCLVLDGEERRLLEE